MMRFEHAVAGPRPRHLDTAEHHPQHLRDGFERRRARVVLNVLARQHHRGEASPPPPQRKTCTDVGAWRTTRAAVLPEKQVRKTRAVRHDHDAVHLVALRPIHDLTARVALHDHRLHAALPRETLRGTARWSARATREARPKAPRQRHSRDVLDHRQGRDPSIGRYQFPGRLQSPR